MDATPHTYDEQGARWNGASGNAWVDAQPVLDAMFQLFENLLVEGLDPERGGHLLDVGCGTGGTTIAAARRLGPTGHCVGIDISSPMIAAARARAERAGAQADFIHADAQDHPFDPATFDTIISRFGVMFFTDFPRAFANLRRAAKPEAELRLIAWRAPADNPFMTTAERAAAPLLPNIPTRQPDAPGQFAFADPSRVRRILDESGWTAIDLRPLDVPCTFPEPDLIPYFTRLGPLSPALPEAEADAPTRARVIETVRTAFDPYVHGPDVRFTAACWLISARAPRA